MKRVDVLVVGGGAAGVAAAVSARRLGATTLLIERDDRFGGMATSAEVGTICGLYYRSSEKARFASRGFEREFASYFPGEPLGWERGLWFLPYRPEHFHRVCERLLEETGVECWRGFSVNKVLREDSRIGSVFAERSGEKRGVLPGAVVDCSGSAIISALGGVPMLHGERYQAGALVFRVQCNRDISAESFSREVILSIIRGVEQGRLSDELRRTSVIPGSFSSGSNLEANRAIEATATLSLKLSLPALMSGDEEFADKHGRGLIRSLSQYLVEEGSCFQVEGIASRVGVRTGARSWGEYCLSEEDVLRCATFDDWVALGVWPMEEWGEERKPKMTYFDEEHAFQIPARSLISQSVKNLFFAGRCMCADESAIAASRVIGTCLGTGAAAGVLASGVVKGEEPGCSIRQIQAGIASEKQD